MHSTLDQSEGLGYPWRRVDHTMGQRVNLRRDAGTRQDFGYRAHAGAEFLLDRVGDERAQSVPANQPPRPLENSHGRAHRHPAQAGAIDQLPLTGQTSATRNSLLDDRRLQRLGQLGAGRHAAAPDAQVDSVEVELVAHH